jgi:dihydrofolate reductase
MARILVWNLITLDGYFEGPAKWDLGFHMDAWSDDLAALSLEFGRRAGLLVFGRVTYEGMKAHWTSTEELGEIRDYMNAHPKLVASRTISESDWNNTRITADPVAELTRLRAEPGKEIFVFGSAELSDSLFAAGLVDEVMLALVPVSIGAGTPFFKRPWKFRTTDARVVDRGVTLLRYAPA